MPTRKAAAPATVEDAGEWRAQIPAIAPPGSQLVAIDDDEADADDIGARIRAALGSASGDSVVVKLYRRSPQTRRLEWCDDYTPAEAEGAFHETVRNAWGPGMYEARIVGRTGNMGRLQLDIAPRTAPAVVAAPAQSELSHALAAILETQRAMLERINAPPPPAPPPPTMRDMLQDLALMRQVFAPPEASKAPQQSQAAALKEMVEVVRGLREVAGEVSGEPREETPMQIVGSLLEIVKGSVNKAPQPMQPLALPSSIQHASAVVPQTATEADNPMLKLLIQGIAAKLITLAQNGNAPEAGAEFLYEQLPDEALPLLALPNWWDFLAVHAPELAPHRAWVESAKAALDAMLSQDADDQSVDAGGVDSTPSAPGATMPG